MVSKIAPRIFFLEFKDEKIEVSLDSRSQTICDPNSVRRRCELNGEDPVYRTADKRNCGGILFLKESEVVTLRINNTFTPLPLWNNFIHRLLFLADRLHLAL